MGSDGMRSAASCQGVDCSTIAKLLFDAAGGEGRVLTITPSAGRALKVLEFGKVDESYVYHSIYTDSRYVFDPRMAPGPVPKGDWDRLMRGLNPGAQIKVDWP
jgi:filamentous hemagglutinin